MRRLIAGLIVASLVGSASPSAAGDSPRSVLDRARAIVRSGASAGMVVRLTAPGRPGTAGPLFDFDEAALAPAGRVRVGDGRACGALLDRRLPHEFTGWPFGTAALVIGAATGRNIPDGVVGTCSITALGNHERRVRVARQTTVRSALDAVVAQAPGVVWLAVEGVDGACGLGFYGLDLTQPPPGWPRRIGEKFCMVQLGTVPPRARRKP